MGRQAHEGGDAARADGHEALHHTVLHEDDGDVAARGACKKVLRVRGEGHARELPDLLSGGIDRVGGQRAPGNVQVRQADGLPTARCEQVLARVSPLDVLDKAAAESVDRRLRAERGPGGDQATGSVIHEDALIHNVSTRVQVSVVVGKADAVNAVVLLLEAVQLPPPGKAPQDHVRVLPLLAGGTEVAPVRDGQAGDKVVVALHKCLLVRVVEVAYDDHASDGLHVVLPVGTEVADVLEFHVASYCMLQLN
mmetsp:Transcript_11241/g.35697  ORF Transcript_11241/g.35697 Transcript_11241/m.35697 type:complete len:252 (-) Transcript_11241:43-798(-)